MILSHGKAITIESCSWKDFISVANASWYHWNCGRTQRKAATINQLACPSYSLYVQLLWYPMYYPGGMKARVGYDNNDGRIYVGYTYINFYMIYGDWRLWAWPYVPRQWGSADDDPQVFKFHYMLAQWSCGRFNRCDSVFDGTIISFMESSNCPSKKDHFFYDEYIKSYNIYIGYDRFYWLI